ncbi:LOW QUALITY PROTEIN: hypothetical protein OSB04_011465 [Centaurea solstitialis]|uniref:Uncharacterized protein n=1 Tax=Centaurea solstitialis TaxID=347529 RepID=A0AA38WQ40_9ASTR|nr:LOW QUALITY PROTEIN: hypothetical protein OSB04_011465 [Centaurea solstitialis]
MFRVFGGYEDEISVTGYTYASFQTDIDDFRSQVRLYSKRRRDIMEELEAGYYRRFHYRGRVHCSIRRSKGTVVASISRPVDIYCDNSGAVAQAKEPRKHHKSRHYHHIREIIGIGDVRICKIPMEDNVTDPLTKPLARVKHEVHVNSIGMQYLDISSYFIVLPGMLELDPPVIDQTKIPLAGMSPRYDEKQLRINQRTKNRTGFALGSAPVSKEEGGENFLCSTGIITLCACLRLKHVPQLADHVIGICVYEPRTKNWAHSRKHKIAYVQQIIGMLSISVPDSDSSFCWKGLHLEAFLGHTTFSRV